jgi:Ca2+-binding RTX toxin-like protein
MNSITVDGGSGNDSFYASRLSETLRGGPGHDYYSFGYLPLGLNLGNKTIVENNNEGDWDWLDFGGIDAAISVDLNDTTPNKTVATGILSLTIPNATGLEGVTGTAYGDTIKGNSRSNSFYGQEGNDQLEGRDGNDYYNYGGDIGGFDFAGEAESCPRSRRLGLSHRRRARRLGNRSSADACRRSVRGRVAGDERVG